MVKNQKINILEKFFESMSILEKKRRARLICLKSLKLLQKTSLKNHKVLLKLSIVTSVPILKLKSRKLRKKVEYYPSFITLKKAILRLAKVINSRLNKTRITNSYHNLKENIISLIKEPLLQTKQIETNNQNQALKLKKVFRFKWFY